AVSSASGQAAGPASAAAPSGAAGLGLSTIGLHGWTVQSTRVVTQPGEQVSTPGFPTAGWLPVRPDDAGAPGTEIEAILQNGMRPHAPGSAIHEGPPMDAHSVFFSDNLRRCFGLMDTVGPDTVPEFQVPWWFRTDFTAGPRPDQAASIVLN